MKTKIIIAIFLIFLLKENTFCQFKQIKLTGHVYGVDTGVVQFLIEPFSDTNIVKLIADKVILQKGVFKISGKIRYPYPTRIIINDSIYSDIFFLESGKLTSQFVWDSSTYLTSKILSSTNNEYVNNYQKEMKFTEDILGNWYEKYSFLSQNYLQEIPLPIEDSMQALKQKICNKIDTLNLSYTISHKSSYIALWKLLENGKKRYNRVIDKTFYSLDKKLQNSITGVQLEKILIGRKKTENGSIFPDIPVMDSSFKIHKINNKLFKKYTLLNFWFSHCGPCIIEFPKLKIMYSSYENKNFQIIGISVDIKSNRSNWLNEIRKNELPWPQYWDVDYKQATDLGIILYPRNFLLDFNGKIIGSDLELNEIEKFLSENL
jgi:thiol-disulfide isomerase/thioredoxin